MNIQIFGTKKCNDTKKAERFFKERGIKYQFIDMKEKGMSKGEFQAVASVNGGMENMINPSFKDKDLLALIQYIAPEDGQDTGESTGDQDTGCAEWKAVDTWISSGNMEDVVII